MSVNWPWFRSVQATSHYRVDRSPWPPDRFASITGDTRLAVWMYGCRVATLSRRHDRLAFEYSEGALDRWGGRAGAGSLAGVQQKVVLTRLPDGSWTLPIHGLPSTHILNRAQGRWPHMVENEALCLAVGRHAGIEVARAEVLSGSEAILVVERYDRRRGNDATIARIHQEDMTQALSLGFATKYEEHDGPSLRTIARVLGDWTPRSASREHLLDVSSSVGHLADRLPAAIESTISEVPGVPADLVALLHARARRLATELDNWH